MFEFISNILQNRNKKHDSSLPQSTVEKVPVFQGEDPGSIEVDPTIDER